MPTIKRGLSYDNFKVLENSEVINVSLEDLRKITGAHDLARIQKDEYEQIDGSQKFFTNFNIEDTDVCPPNIYILPKIVNPGFYDHIEEKGEDPVLSFEDVFVGKCVKVNNNVKYEDIDPRVFEYSMKHIKNVEELREAIWKRYHKSMPRLTREEVESLGVAISTHEIIGRQTFKFKK